MVLDEIIERRKEAAEHDCYRVALCFSPSDCKQLAEWLEELKKIQEKGIEELSPMIKASYATGYNKGYNDGLKDKKEAG